MAEAEDQASQLLRIARLAWATGDPGRALRLVQRSLRLRDSAEGRELLADYESRAARADGPSPDASTSRPGGASSSSAATGGSGGPKVASPSSSPEPRTQPQPQVKREPAAADPPKKTRSFTPEQQEVARQILRKAKDYYDVLGVPRTATSKEITSAFRKQARLLHPDKNPAPEADEAFKLLNRAHECLGDEGKRRMYDVSGRDESVPEVRRRPARGFDQHAFAHGGPMDAEDLFHFMFSGGDPQFFFRQQQARRRAQQQHYQHQQQQHRQDHTRREPNPLAPLFQILPILLILLLSWMTMPSANSGSHSMASDFRFAREHPFTVARETANDVPYFVTMATHHRVQRDPSALRRLEDRVESDYADLARLRCQAEREEIHKLEHRIRTSKGRERDRALGSLHDLQGRAEWCDRLQRFHAGMSL